MTDNQVNTLLTGAVKYDWYWCIVKGTDQDCFGRLCRFVNNGLEFTVLDKAERAFWKLFLRLHEEGYLKGWDQFNRSKETILDVLLAHVPKVREAYSKQAFSGLLAQPSWGRHNVAEGVAPPEKDLSPDQILAQKLARMSAELERAQQVYGVELPPVQVTRRRGEH
jgi:hypothetical protein